MAKHLIFFICILSVPISGLGENKFLSKSSVSSFSSQKALVNGQVVEDHSNSQIESNVSGTGVGSSSFLTEEDCDKGECKKKTYSEEGKQSMFDNEIIVPFFGVPSEGVLSNFLQRGFNFFF